MRSRPFITIILLLVVALGLASRKFPLPNFLAANTGDALWTVAVYLTLAFVFPHLRPLHLGLAALSISLAVELSQLIDTPWLNTLRQTLPGKLLLGQGFQWLDLPRYLAGATLAALTDSLLTHRKKPTP